MFLRFTLSCLFPRQLNHSCPYQFPVLDDLPVWNHSLLNSSPIFKTHSSHCLSPDEPSITALTLNTSYLARVPNANKNFTIANFIPILITLIVNCKPLYGPAFPSRCSVEYHLYKILFRTKSSVAQYIWQMSHTLIY